MLIAYKGHKPIIHSDTFIAAGAKVIGDVTMQASSSIWFNSIIRGDAGKIVIGKYTNIQDNCVIHENTVIGDYVTVGHNAVLHGCSIEDHCIIGMGAIILSGATVGRGSIIAAGSLIKEGQIIPAHSLVVGAPGRAIKAIPEKVDDIHTWALGYVSLWKEGYQIIDA